MASERPDLEAIVAPLRTLCEARDFTFTWRTAPDGSGWRADVKAGYPKVSGQHIGAHPWWRCTGTTEAGALRRVIETAVQHWTPR